MFYHSRKLEYLKNKKRQKQKDDIFFNCYKWLSYHSKFDSFVWLSKNNIDITGFSYKYQVENDYALFCFDKFDEKDIIPVNFSFWEIILGFLINEKKSDKKHLDKCVEDGFNEILSYADEEELKNEKELIAWIDSDKDVDKFVKKHLFTRDRQYIKETLDLEKSKKIICRNEKQKEILIKKGFDKEIILIKTIKHPKR